MDFKMLESRVYSGIVTMLKSKYSSKYPDMSFDTVIQRTEPKFPFIYVHLLPAEEIMGDLSGKTVNGINATFEVSVTHNSDKDIVRDISYEILEYMKSLSFRATMPEIDTRAQGIYVGIARYRRNIGADDIL